MDVAGIREAREKSPFEPFTVRLADGRALPVPHREFISVSPGGRRVIVYGKDDSVAMVEPLLIASLEFGNRGPAATADK
jgi:hypothetical protein